MVKESSVYIHATGQLNTQGAGTYIDIRGAHDVDILGAVVAGGEIGEDGVTFAGADSTIEVRAGEQIYLDNALSAARSVTLSAGSAGADDNNLAIVAGTVSGMTAAGITSDGSGGTVTLNTDRNPVDLSDLGTHSDIWMMGHIYAGGEAVQEFNEDNELIGETVNWSDEGGRVFLNAGGQVVVGGETENKAGETVETGGYIRALDLIEITGGENPQGIGVYVPAAAELVTSDPSGVITICSVGDAEILGLLVAGGQVQEYRDADGEYLGRTIEYFDGDSEIHIHADNQIRLGLDLKAGKLIDLVGGQGAAATDLDDVYADYAENGLLLQGSVHLATWRPESIINLNASGPISILAPAYINELFAGGFIESATGRLTADVTLDILLDRVDFTARGQVTIAREDTADNTGISDLLADIQNALDSHEYIVVESDTGDHPVDSTYSWSADDQDIEVSLKDSRFLLGGPYEFTILASGSQNADLLGFDTGCGDLVTSRSYAVDAPAAGSVVNIGAPEGPNGEVYIGGMVRAYEAINIRSSESDTGMDVDLDYTGVLETVDGPITFRPTSGVIKGDLIAGGDDSDITVIGHESIVVMGRLEAGGDIFISAGVEICQGAESIRITPTSEILSTGGNGRIVLTGVNDVIINGQIGHGSTNLSLVQVTSEHGDILVAKEGGRIETGARISFLGNNVEVAGVLSSTYATDAAFDYEVTIDIEGTATIHGDIDIAGSMLVSADTGVYIYDTALIADGAGQRLNIESNGPIVLGMVGSDAYGDPVQWGATLGAASELTIETPGAVNIQAAVVLYSIENDSLIDIDAGSVQLTGSVYGGAGLNDQEQPVWSGQRATVHVRAEYSLTVGGKGYDDNGALVDRGGVVKATGLVDMQADGSSGTVFTVTGLSALGTDATGDGTWSPDEGGEIIISSGGGIQITGTVQNVDADGSVTISGDGLVLVDGTVLAQKSLSISGGTHSSGVGLFVEGSLNAAAPGDIILSGVDDIVISGLAGIGAGESAESGSVSAHSQNGAVTVIGAVNARDRVELRGLEVNIMPGGLVRATETGGDVYLRGELTAVVFGATDLAAARVKAVDVVHLYGGELSVQGEVEQTAANGRVLLNSSGDMNISGLITAEEDIEANAGVDNEWSEATLTAEISVADLSSGTIGVEGAGSSRCQGRCYPQGRRGCGDPGHGRTG